jgi:membrane protein implicated in regulation of membrane protease activity
VVIAWLVVGAVLLLFELHHYAFYALFVAIGSFAAAVVALAAPSAIGLQAGVAGGLAVGGIVVVRPFVSKAFHHRQGGRVAHGVHGGLIGEEVVTLDDVGDTHHVGHVRLSGERWLAVSGTGTSIAAGTTVVVTSIRGTTLVVLPVDGMPGRVPGLQPGTGEAPDGADGSGS